MEGVSGTISTAHSQVLLRSTPFSDMLTGSEREPHLRQNRRMRPVRPATQWRIRTRHCADHCAPPTAHRRWNVPLRFELNSASGIRFRFSYTRPSAIVNPAMVEQWAWKTPPHCVNKPGIFFSPALCAEQLLVLPETETHRQGAIARKTDGCCHADK